LRFRVSMPMVEKADDRRKDIQSVFDPVFNQIFQLVQDQINTVKASRQEKIQVPSFSREMSPRIISVCHYWGYSLSSLLSFREIDFLGLFLLSPCLSHAREGFL
jgi:hypothetical protein